MKKIAVLGGGHGVHTMAADLALKGFEVNMCEAPEFEEGIKKTIDLIDALGKDFYLYGDGTTLSIARGIRSVFEEVSKVADAIGVKMLEYPEEDFWKRSTIMSTYFRATFDKDGAAAKISGPSSFKSRYITEDLPFGLVPIKKMANHSKVSTPVIDAVITFASVINQTDYMKKGLSLEELGIAGLNVDELKQVLG